MKNSSNNKKILTRCEKYKRHNQRQGFSTLTETIDHTECCCHMKISNNSNWKSFSSPQVINNPNNIQDKSKDIKEFGNFKL